MRSHEATALPVSRRALLGSAAVAAGGFASTASATAGAETPEFSVMTRNLYVGVDLFRLFRARNIDEVRAIAGELLAEVESHPYEARAGAIAEEIAATAPAVVGLQEGVLIRTRSPSEFDGDHDPGADEVVVDLLETLQSELGARGLPYGVATGTVTSDIEVPADTDDGTVDLRLTDRVALLVRDDVDVTDTRSGVFEADFPVPLDDTEVTIRRGYCRLDARVGDEEVTAATAHLESADADVRRSQADELRGLLPDDRPVALAGDDNSTPGGETYARLAEDFEDAHAALRPDASGHTCCQDADLRNEDSKLSARIDHAFSRGDFTPLGIERVGADPGDRVAAEIDGESVQVWPSDHAGVVASFGLPAPETPTATSTGTATRTTTEPSTATDSATESETTPTAEPQPGMGVLAALVGAAVGVLSRLRGRDEE